MNVARALALLLAVTSVSCAERDGIVRWEDVEQTPARSVRSVPAPVEPAPPAALPLAPEPAPTPPAAPSPLPTPAPVAPIAVAPTMVVNGVPVLDGALVELPALDLACIADVHGLTEPARVLARIAEQGQKIGASLGPFAFVVLERDPARSLTDPPPQLCRALQGTAVLIAPMLHKSEPAGRWLVRRARDGVAADAAALLADCETRGLLPSGRPRVIVDDRGAMVAVAVPVSQGGP